MSADDDLGFALPPFNAEQGLAHMKRALRDAKLVERGTGFELRGKRVAELAVKGPAIEARLARRWVLTPEWDCHTLKNTAEQRRWLDDLKKRLARWDSGED